MKYWYMICAFILLLACKPKKETIKDKMNDIPTMSLKYDPLKNYVHDTLKHLLPILENVLLSDQKYRKGNDVARINQYRDSINYIDSVNLSIVEPIIARYGILGAKEIGFVGYYAITMTIQHGDLDIHKKYLPYVEEAFQKKKMMASTYSLFIDRLLTQSNKSQLYGTQIMVYKKGRKTTVELLPVLNPDSLETRRKKLGLTESLQFYLQRFGGKWDLEKYKEQLPELKKKYKVLD